MKIMKKITREEGITLVALVVTIIILLILAGVAIATVTGDNGLFRKAREAVNAYKDSEANESQSLDYIAGQLGDLAKYDYNGYAKSTMEMTVADGTYYLPAGFKLAEDSGKTINEGIVVEDKNGNQWVWIPCYVEGGKGADVANAVKYDRYAFSSDGMGAISQIKLTKTDEEGNTVSDLDVDGSQKIGWSYNSYYFHEAINSEDQASVRKFGGYYIGRYEAGDGTVTNLSTPRLRTESDKGGNQTNTVTIKKGQAPYNWVTQAQSVTLSNGIAAANNYDNSKMYTKLCSSYAWDTALKFIETRKSEYAEFGNSSKIEGTVYGNCAGVEVSYKDIEGADQTKVGSESLLIPTGQTRAVCNIYDLDGNAWEYISESFSGPNRFARRGGRFSDPAYHSPAGYRADIYELANVSTSFRAALYLKY